MMGCLMDLLLLVPVLVARSALLYRCTLSCSEAVEEKDRYTASEGMCVASRRPGPPIFSTQRLGRKVVVVVSIMILTVMMMELQQDSSSSSSSSSGRIFSPSSWTAEAFEVGGKRCALGRTHQRRHVAPAHDYQKRGRGWDAAVVAGSDDASQSMLSLSAATKGGAAANRGGKKKDRKESSTRGGGFGKNAARRTSSTPAQQEPSVETSGRTTAAIENDVVLDKWGLPPPTVDDVFPPLPKGTELVPVPTGAEYTLEQIQNALRNVVPLPLHRQFDERGVERRPPPTDRQGNPLRSAMKLRLLHVSPPVLAIDNFFTPDECEFTRQQVLATSSPTTASSSGSPVQVHSKTFEGAISKRTSTSWFCYYHQHPILLAKARHVLGLELWHMEEPQVVRYTPGQEFTYHYDQVPAHQLDNGGQRLATLLVYLNTVPRSGGTKFRDLLGPDGSPLTVRPVQGSALLFFPADASGIPDDRTLHCGEPLMDDEEKWIVQMWTHQRTYRASVPPNNRQDDAVVSIEETARKLGLLAA